jgi:hypothetical protein
MHMQPHAANLPWSHGPIDWIPGAEPHCIIASENDVTVRPIGVTALLEDVRLDIRTLESLGIDITLDLDTVHAAGLFKGSSSGC